MEFRKTEIMNLVQRLTKCIYVLADRLPSVSTYIQSFLISKKHRYLSQVESTEHWWWKMCGKMDFIGQEIWYCFVGLKWQNAGWIACTLHQRVTRSARIRGDLRTFCSTLSVLSYCIVCGEMAEKVNNLLFITLRGKI